MEVHCLHNWKIEIQIYKEYLSQCNFQFFNNTSISTWIERDRINGYVSKIVKSIMVSLNPLKNSLHFSIVFISIIPSIWSQKQSYVTVQSNHSKGSRMIPQVRTEIGNNRLKTTWKSKNRELISRAKQMVFLLWNYQGKINWLGRLNQTKGWKVTNPNLLKVLKRMKDLKRVWTKTKKYCLKSWD